MRSQLNQSTALNSKCCHQNKFMLLRHHSKGKDKMKGLLG